MRSKKIGKRHGVFLIRYDIMIGYKTTFNLYAFFCLAHLSLDILLKSLCHLHLQCSNQSFSLQYAQLCHLRHENLAHTIGIYCGSDIQGLVMELRARGSLQSLILCREVSLDKRFKLSLIQDLAKVRYCEVDERK